MNNTVSLEVAKKLKGAGWKRICHYYGYTNKEGIYEISCDVARIALSEIDEVQDLKWHPQMHEILDELPALIEIDKLDNEWYVKVYNGCSTQASYNPHDACALLWIYCKENNYL